LVAIDYFTKWTEAVPLKNMTHKEVIEFITEHIIYRFDIPQTLTTDQGTSFVSKEVREFAKLYKISYSIHLHTMLKLMAKLSLVIRL
jgi:ABC-type enterochelin transport system permease subunit